MAKPYISSKLNKKAIYNLYNTKKIIEQKILEIGNICSDGRIYDEISEWELEDDMIKLTTEDYWSDGTHDFESVTFPVEYLLMENEEVEKIMKEIFEKAKLEAQKQKEMEEKEKYERLKKKFEEEQRDWNEYQKLKKKFELEGE